MNPDKLVKAARTALNNAHAPYSGYKVGAALLCTDGTVFTGCNVEHIVLALTCCAEQVAVFKAVSEGARDLREVAVFTQSSPPAAPCGSCRQMLDAWGVERVVLNNPHGERVETTLDALLPMRFTLTEPVAERSA